VAFDGPVYVGLGVCAHAKDVIESAVFSNVELTTAFPPPTKKPVLYSTLETQVMASTDRRVVHVTPSRIEARTGSATARRWSTTAAAGSIASLPPGQAGSDRHRLRYPVQQRPRGFARRNATGYQRPVAGRPPVAHLHPAAGRREAHAGNTDRPVLLARLVAGRQDAGVLRRAGGKYDVYTIPATGGPETRLTTAKGLNDGPEYSPDGKHIYFNSDRTGRMHLWRMKADGAGQEQVTADEYNNWFPHPSPDGRTLVFLSYEKDVAGHPENKDVTLRRMTLGDRKITVLGRFFGGQGRSTCRAGRWTGEGSPS